MKKIYFIHENTKPYKVKDGFIMHIPTDFVVTVGYVADMSSRSIWANPGGTFLLETPFEGLYFETQEEGEKVLLKYLRVRQVENIKITDTMKDLSHQYPEALL